jgi:hypothetical protein
MGLVNSYVWRYPKLVTIPENWIKLKTNKDLERTMKKSYCVLLVVMLAMVAMDMKHKDEIMARRDENVIAQVAFV